VAKNLLIVESPGKVKTISKVLGKDFVVKASVGHVRDLPTSDKDAIDYKNNFQPKYVVVESRKKVIAELRKAADKAETVYLCPDPDREGEAIAWHLSEALELDPKRTVRVSFEEITPRGIKTGMSNPRQIDMDLVNSQQARRVLDRIVGYKLSNLLWEKLVRGLSAGRVQSVALRLIAEREKEIRAFRAEEYWSVEAVFKFNGQQFDGTLRALEGKQVVNSAEDLSKFKSGGQGSVGASGIVRTLIATQSEAQDLVNALNTAKYAVSYFETKEVQDRPYPPFATSQLQQASANRLGFDAKRTMRVAQQLYEGVPLGEQGPVALITYMRTDSFRVSPDALNECRDMIGKRYGNKYLPEKPNYYASRKGAQEAHECIRPTHVEIAPEEVKKFVSEEQYKLYKLIWDRFVTSQMVPAIFDATTVDIAAEGVKTRNSVFRATGRVIKFDGWLAVQGGAAAAASHVEASAADREKGDEADAPQEDEAGSAAAAGAKPVEKKKPKKKPGSQLVPAMKQGDRPNLEELAPEQHFTQPPPRYTDASLVKTLEREGIGRPSTYASIISTILDRGYIERMGKGGRGSFMAAPLGEVVVDRLTGHFPSIMELGFTREMEEELDKIAEAHLDWQKVIAEFYGPFARDLEKAKKSMVSTKEKGEPTDVKCPDCAAPMEKRLSKFGFYLRCTKAPECKSTLRLDALGNIQEKIGPQPTGIVCDKCGSPVFKATGRFGPYLHCEKYPEKKCDFTMKVDKQGLPVRKFSALATEKKCEKCKSPLVVRVTARGKAKQPRPFLSCSNFPKCRHAEDLPPDLATLGEQALAQWRENDAKNKRDQATFAALMAEQAAAEPAEAGAE